MSLTRDRAPDGTRHRGPSTRNVRGFTLVELVVTFALVALLTMLAVPSFTTWIQNTKVRAVADSLQTGVRLAQTEAVRRNQQVVLSLTNATPGLGVAAASNGSNWSAQTVAQFGGTATFIQGGALADMASGVSINSSINAICFNSNGRMVTNASSTGVPGASCAATGPATFDITRTSADRRLRVIVQLGGQVHMCDPDRPTLSSTSPDGCPATTP
jgi:type IV fimbrial biogenesis protein FimT